MRRIYSCLLALFPEDYRRAFGSAMLDAFAARALERRAAGRLPLLLYLVGEYGSLVRSAGSEWIDTIVSPPFRRDMTFRDPSRMRPPGASKRDWYARL